MLSKELIIARWRLMLCALIVVVAALIALITVAGDLQGSFIYLGVVPRFYDPWFTNSGPPVLSLIAAILGGELIGGEARKGTIGFLLSRPISRDRILLAKYWSSAVMLFGLTLLGSTVDLLVFSFAGSPPSVGDIVIGTLLLWFNTLGVLGVALVLSVVFNDELGPLLSTMLLLLALNILDGYLMLRGDGSIWRYWPTYTVYFRGETLIIAFAIWLVTLVLSLSAAVLLFRHKAY